MELAVRRKNRTKDRRYSLPARVNVLVFNNGQPPSTQLADLAAQVHQRGPQGHPAKPQPAAPSSYTNGHTEEPTSTSNSRVEPRTAAGGSAAQYLSLVAIPEDTESVCESLDDETQEVTNNEDEIVLLDPAPDGGYGWVIVLASFLCNLVVDGIAYTFGLFFNHFVTHFGASKGKTALAGSLLSGCYMSAGPLVSALTNKFGCRAVTIAGSIISCIAFLLSAMSPNINCLLFTYGFMGGIGFGLIYLPAIVSVGYYFNSKRAFATGIAVCGSGVGAFIFAPLCQLALTYYDWRGALVIQAGLALNCAVFGALMRPLHVEAETVNHQVQLAVDERGDETKLLLENADSRDIPFNRATLNREPGVQSINDLNKIQSVTKLPERLELTNGITTEDEVKVLLDPIEGPALRDSAISLSGGSLTMNMDPLGSPKQRASSTTVQLPLPDTREFRAIGQGTGRYAGKRAISDCTPPPLHVILSSNPGISSRRRSSVGLSQAITVRPIAKRDVFYSGSTTSMHKRASVVSRGEIDRRASTVSIPARDVLSKINRELVPATMSTRTQVLSTFKKASRCADYCQPPRVLKEMIDFSLLRNHPSFALLALSNVFGMMGFYIPFVYIVQHLRTQVKDGDDFVSAEKAALVLSVIGITNTIGRIIFGWISDKVTNPEKNTRVTALLINNFCVMIAGVTVMAIPYLTSYWSIMLNCTIFGLFISAYICLTSIIIVELLGLDKLTNAFGLISMFRGMAAMLGPPLAGTIYDFTGSFDLTFYAAGLLLVLSAVVSFFIPEQLKKKAK